MTLPLARLAMEGKEALVRAAMLALRDVEDDTFDVDDMSADGFAVEVDDPDVEERRRQCAEAALRLFVSRLSGTALARQHLLALRHEHGEDALLVALSGIADALATVGRPLTDGEIVAVHRARADARTLLQSPHDVSGTEGATSALDADDDLDEPDADRGDAQSVARALASTVDAVMAADERGNDIEAVGDGAGGGVPTTPHVALLRFRVPTGDAARALAGVADVATMGGLVQRVSSSPDELIVTAHGADAVGTLVRAAAAVATALPEGAPLRCALVVTTGDLVNDVVAAADLMPPLDGTGGRLALDDKALALAHELAELPGLPGVVDPRAPHGQERWEQSALLARPSFCGRDDDVMACADVLRRGGDAPVALVLGGPPGIGKSSLLRAALREAGVLDEHAALAWGASDALQPTPYAAIVGMVRALARAPAGHPRAPARITQLVHGLAAVLKDAQEQQELLALTDVIRDLLGAGDDLDDDVAERRSPRTLRTSIRRAVLLIGKALLARAGDDRPLVFVVSAAEAMDAPTRDCLTFVAQRLGPRVRVALLSSSSKLKLPAAFEEIFAVTRRDVRPLKEPDTLAVARDLLDVTDDDLDDDVRRCLTTLAERAKGSPLFAAHAVRWAVEGGYISRHGFMAGGWSSTRIDVIGSRLPNRIDRLLSARVQRLPTAARQVLGHCAALGSTFLPAAVEFVGLRLGLSRDEVQQAVRLLTETGFLARSQRRAGAPVFIDDDNNDALLVFEHPLLRAAAEQALSDDEAKAVHGVVADALEALMDTRAVAPQLARHHKLAERRRRAVEHLVVAVRRARRLDDRQGAITMANEALELVSTDERDVVFTLQLELSAVLESSASQGEKAQRTLKDTLKQLVRAADKTGDPHRQALALSRVARFNLFLGDVTKAEEAALRALARAREITPPSDIAATDGSVDVDTAPRGQQLQPALARQQAGRRGSSDTTRVRDVLRLLALIRFAARDVDGARRALDEARRLTPTTERRVLGGIEHQTGLFLLERNDPLGALEHLLVAFAHKRATADLAGEAACLDAIADVYVRSGHLWTALSLLVRALAIREAIGDDGGFAQSLKNRADVLLMTGDVEAACHEAQRARVLSKSLGLDRLEHQSAVVLARAELTRKDATAAEAILDAVRRRVDDQRDPFSAMECELLSARAKWLRAQGAVGSARDRLLKSALSRARAAVDLGEKRGYLSGQVLGNALLGEVLLSSGDVSAALPHAQRAAELLDDRTATGLPVEEALSPYIQALRAMGDDDEASAVAGLALSLLTERASRLPEAVRARFWAVPTRQAMLHDATTAAAAPVLVNPS